MKAEFMKFTKLLLLTSGLAFTLGACGDNSAAPTDAEPDEKPSEAVESEEGVVKLNAQQIATAAIELGRPTIGGAASISLPGTIEADPQAMQAVSAAISGRIISLNRNLGQNVQRGDILAIIESREAAQMNADVEAARARLTLAKSNLNREQRLFSERVSPEQDLIAARTAATEASIALRLAQQQVAAAGGSGGALNRIAVRAPASGQIIQRSAVIGQTVAADTELFRVANLSALSLTLNLQPVNAGQIRQGSIITVTAPSRQTTARVSFISPALDPQTRLVSVIALLKNGGNQWRIGELVTATIDLEGADSGQTVIQIPSTSVQTIEGRATVFVRTHNGFRAVQVELGDPSGDMITVRKGLTGTEQIATKGSFTLKAELGKGEVEHGGH